MGVPGVRKVTSDDDLRWYWRGDQQLRLADAIDSDSEAAMTVGFGRYSAGESNDWVMSYDEALIVTKGSFAVDSGGESTVAGPGEVIYLSPGTPVTLVNEHLNGREDVATLRKRLLELYGLLDGGRLGFFRRIAYLYRLQLDRYQNLLLKSKG